jgi:hypothetical protein
LDRRAIGQLSAGYPGGESKIVLDPGGRRGLPPDATASTATVLKPSDAP